MAEIDDPMRVLLVEESDRDAHVIEDTLARTGLDLRVRRASDAAAFVEALDEAWDVIVLDETVPGMSPVDAVTTVKERGSAVPVVVLTTETDEASVRDLLTQGVTDYVRKDRLHRLVLSIQRIRRELSMQKSIYETQKRYRALVESVPAVVYSAGFGTDGAWTYVSPYVTTMLGYEPRRLLDDPSFYPSIVHPADAPGLFAEEERCRAQGSPLSYEYRLFHADGSVVWVRDEATVVLDERGRPAYFHGFLFDITDRKMSEDAIAAERDRARRAESQLGDRAAQQEGLAGLGHFILRERSMDSILRETTKVVVETLRADASVIFKRIDGASMAVRAVSGLEQGIVGELVSVGPETIAGRALSVDQPIVVADAEPEDPSATPFMRRNGMRSAIGSIVRDSDGAFGTVVAFWREPREHSAEEINFLRTVGHLLASALRRDQFIEEIRFQSQMLEAVDAVVVVVDRNGAITYWNEAATRVTGWTRDEAVGRDILDLLVIPQDTDRAAEILDDLSGGARSEGEWRLRSKGGRTIPFFVSSAPFLDARGEVEAIIGVAVDITDRKAMERELRESESRFRTAFTRSPMGMVIGDPSGRWLEVNPAICEMLGYEREELLDLHYSAITHPHDLDASAVELERLLEGPTGMAAFKKRYLRKDGSIVWADLHASVVRDVEGAPVSMIIQIQDVTREHEADLEKARLEGQLMQAQKMEAVGRLAGGIAHDFNNLLSVIINYASFLDEEIGEGDPKKEDVREIRRAGDRAATLVKQLLAFSRKEVAAASVVDLNEVLREMDALLRRAVGEDIDLEVRTEPRIWPVKVDPSQVEQVLMNLVVNARDAMPSGGKLVVETRNRDVSEEEASFVPGLFPGRYGRISVIDSGEGMPPEIVEHIFEPFFTTKPRGRGTGLGLSTVYGIVKQWRGYVGIESTLGEGTTFHIYLPITEEAADDDTAPEAGPSPVTGSETILVVEDEEAVREMVDRILTRNGYRVLTARSGAEALGMSDRLGNEIDLLLTDVVMPQMSGKDLVEKISSTRADLKAIYMSGYADDLVAKSGILRAGEIFLQKPFDAEQLLTMVRDVLEG